MTKSHCLPIPILLALLLVSPALASEDSCKDRSISAGYYLDEGVPPVPGVPAEDLAFTVDFHRGPQGFVAGFSDYPPAAAEIYELTSDYRRLPPPLESQSVLFISGVNRNDDLLMFFKIGARQAWPPASTTFSHPVGVSSID